MATSMVVTSDQYVAVDGKLCEIKRQLRLKDGYPHDLTALDRVLQQATEGKFFLVEELPYANERRREGYVYPPDFHHRVPAQQLNFWAKHFPSLDASHVPALVKPMVPRGAESWGVIPKPSKVGKGKHPKHAALEIMLGLLADQRKFKNWQQGELGHDRLRWVPTTEAWLDQMEAEQPGDFLVFPFQFGLRRPWMSVRRARLVLSKDEFGLGPYEVTTLLLPHPELITGPNQLYLDCIGCEYSPAAGGRFVWCVSLFWGAVHECLELGKDWITLAFPNYGAPSGFRPQ